MAGLTSTPACTQSRITNLEINELCNVFRGMLHSAG